MKEDRETGWVRTRGPRTGIGLLFACYKIGISQESETLVIRERLERGNICWSDTTLKWVRGGGI